MLKKKAWMLQFEPILARNALVGIPLCLVDAFVFDKTPEGHEFWQEQVDNRKLSLEAKDHLRKMLADHRAAYKRPYARKKENE